MAEDAPQHAANMRVEQATAKTRQQLDSLRASALAPFETVEAQLGVLKATALKQIAASGEDPTEIDAIESRLQSRADALLAPLDPRKVDLWKAAYTEAGQWSRHFTTTRATTANVLIAASVGLLYFSWVTGEESLAWLAIGLWAVMVVLFCVLSSFAHTRYRQQGQAATSSGLQAQFDAANPTPKGRLSEAARRVEERWRKTTGLRAVDAGVIAILALTVAFAGAARHRLTTPPPAHTPPACNCGDTG